MTTKPSGPFSETFTSKREPYGIKSEFFFPPSTSTSLTTRGSREITVLRSGVRRRKPSVLDATPFRYERNTFESVGHIDVYNSPGLVAQHSGAIHASYARDLGAAPTSRTLQSRAEVNALLKLKDQSVNLAQAWAERKLTADLVSTSALRIARSVQAFREGKIRKAFQEIGRNPPRDLRRAKNVAKNLPKWWLELQYGWTPLMSDVYGSCEALAKQNHEIQRWMVTVKSGASEKLTDVTNRIAGGGYKYLDFTETENGYFCSLSYTPDNGILAVLSSLGLTNPAALLWELTKASFVVDWFLPIGDWLSALDAAFGWNFHHGSLTHRCVRERTSWGQEYTISGAYRTDASRQKMTQHHHYVNRTVYDSSPVPAFPGFKDPRSVSHALNSIALLAQQFR